MWTPDFRSKVARCSPSRSRTKPRLSLIHILLQERIVAAAEESRHLATLRDTLLPHLMSGRITVRDAEKAVENA